MFRRSRGVTAAIVLTLAAPAVAPQTVFNAAADYSLTYNPGLRWSYRYRIADQESLPLSVPHPFGCFGLSTHYCWTPPPGATPHFSYPHVGEYFATTAAVDGSIGPPVIETNVISMHPDDGVQAVVAFNAAYTDISQHDYLVFAQFQLMDTDPGTSSPVGVVVSVSSQGTCAPIRAADPTSVTLTEFAETHLFLMRCTLTYPQRVEFNVDANGDYTNDTTELSVMIRKVD